MLLLHELPNPDVISFNAAISASGNRGLWQLGLDHETELLEAFSM